MNLLIDERFATETQAWIEPRLEFPENGTAVQSRLPASRRLPRQYWKDFKQQWQPQAPPAPGLWRSWSFGLFHGIAKRVLTQGLLDAQIAEIAQLSLWRQPESIRQFLEAHPNLLRVLFEAFYHVRHVFGQDTVIELDLVTDREGTGAPVVFAYIVTTLPLEQAFPLLDQLDEVWYLSLPEELLKVFNVNLCIK